MLLSKERLQHMESVLAGLKKAKELIEEEIGYLEMELAYWQLR